MPAFTTLLEIALGAALAPIIGVCLYQIAGFRWHWRQRVGRPCHRNPAARKGAPMTVLSDRGARIVSSAGVLVIPWLIARPWRRSTIRNPVPLGQEAPRHE